MMVVNYDPDHLPKMNEFIQYTIPYSNESNVYTTLNKLEMDKQVLFVITCQDGLYFVVRDTKGGAKPPYGIRQIDD